MFNLCIVKNEQRINTYNSDEIKDNYEVDDSNLLNHYDEKTML